MYIYVYLCISMYLKTPENPLENSLVSKNHQKPVVFTSDDKDAKPLQWKPVHRGVHGSGWFFTRLALKTKLWSTTIVLFWFLLLIAYSKLTQNIKSSIYQCTVPIKILNMSTYMPILICSPHPLYQTKSVFYYYPSMYASIYPLSLSICQCLSIDYFSSSYIHSDTDFDVYGMKSNMNNKHVQVHNVYIDTLDITWHQQVEVIIQPSFYLCIFVWYSFPTRLRTFYNSALRPRCSVMSSPNTVLFAGDSAANACLTRFLQGWSCLHICVPKTLIPCSLGVGIHHLHI